MKSSKSCAVCEWIAKNGKKGYGVHRLRHEKRSYRRSNVVVFTLLFLLEVGLLSSNAIGFFSERQNAPVNMELPEANTTPEVSNPDSGIEAIEAILKRHEVNSARRNRLAQAIVSSSRTHNLDSRLVASIMIVESRGNPFAISSANAVGIMQIHVPTWSRVVAEEGIDLFNIEDNVDLGARILKDYVERYGRDEGVKRYNGWRPNNPVSVENAEGYLRKVQHVYFSSGEALERSEEAGS